MINAGKIFLFFCYSLSFLSIIVGVINPQWIYNCSEGERIDCYDEYRNKLEGIKCICENGWEEGYSWGMIVIGILLLITSIIFYLVEIKLSRVVSKL